MDSSKIAGGFIEYDRGKSGGGGNHPYFTSPTTSPEWALDLISKSKTAGLSALHKDPDTIRKVLYDYLKEMAKLDQEYNDAINLAEKNYCKGKYQLEFALLQFILDVKPDGEPIPEPSVGKVKSRGWAKAKP
jgi:hypothetical protein